MPRQARALTRMARTRAKAKGELYPKARRRCSRSVLANPVLAVVEWNASWAEPGADMGSLTA
jgi:hypothetical protein